LSAGFKSINNNCRVSGEVPNILSDLLAAYDLRPANTSQLLAQTWQIMAAYSDKEDGQLAIDDATVPGSKRLGAARADHFAVAVPFETSDESIKAGADKNHNPRTALLEAMVRFVIQDLEGRSDDKGRLR
jgi:hypothetical protein